MNALDALDKARLLSVVTPNGEPRNTRQTVVRIFDGPNGFAVMDAATAWLDSLEPLAVFVGGKRQEQ